MLYRLALACIATAFFPTAGLTQGHVCKDILVNGTKATEEWRNDVFLSQVLEVRSSQRTETENQKQIETGGSYGIISGYGNKNDRDRFLSEIKKSMNFQSILNDQSSVMLSSGDPTIVNAWMACMTRGGGLSLRFESQSAEQSNLIVEWFNYPTAPGVDKTTKLVADVSIPSDVKVDDPTGCLKKDRVLEPRQSCTVQISAPPQKDVSIVLRTLHGEAAAYLPQRLRIVEERKPITAVDEKGKPLISGVSVYDPYKSGPEKCFEAPEGWFILEQSISHPISVSGPMRKSHCFVENFKILAGKRVCWNVRATPNVKGDSKCRAGLNGELVRWKVVPGLSASE